jgi:hypothetical protein
MNLSDFYKFYLSEHENIINRRLHFFGTLGGLILFIFLFLSKKFQLAPIAILFGYGPAWVGHFFYEKNKPASFKHPIYSFICDWIMVKDIILGRVSIWKK